MKDICLSCLRWGIGLSIGSLLGLIFAIIGSFKYSNSILKVIVDFLRALPLIGLIPVIQMKIGVNEFTKIGLISWAVMFPVWILIRNSVETNLSDALIMLNAQKPSVSYRFRHYTFPIYFNGFLKGIEISIGVAWLAVVAGEWVGTFTESFWGGGLGYKLTWGHETNNWSMVYQSLLMFGILGILSSCAFRWTVKRMFNNRNSFNPILKIS